MHCNFEVISIMFIPIDYFTLGEKIGVFTVTRLTLSTYPNPTVNCFESIYKTKQNRWSDIKKASFEMPIINFSLIVLNGYTIDADEA